MVDSDDLDLELRLKSKIINIIENEDNALKEMISKECEHIEFITVTPTLQHSDNEIDNMIRATDITFIVTKGDEEQFQLANKLAERAVSLGSLCVGLILDNEALDFENYFDIFFQTSKENILPIVKLIYGIIEKPGIIGLDYADVKTVLQDGGEAIFGFGESAGENASVNAVKNVIDNPRFTVWLDCATQILFNFIGSSDYMSMFEINKGFEVVQELAHPNANILFGANIDDSMGEKISVGIIATGFVAPDDMIDDDAKAKPMPCDIGLDIPLGWVRGEVGAEVNKNKGTQTVGDYLASLSKKCESNDDLTPHANGKKVCETLRNMRKELAKANNIPFESKDCDFNGLCAGTCEKCDSEAAYLREKLKEIPAKKVKIPRYNFKN